MSRKKMFSDMAGAFNNTPAPASKDRPYCVNTGSIYKHPTKSGNRVRCPECSRLLYLRERHCVGGELIGWKWPPHKIKVKTTKMPSRSRKGQSRKGRK